MRQKRCGGAGLPSPDRTDAVVLALAQVVSRTGAFGPGDVAKVILGGGLLGDNFLDFSDSHLPPGRFLTGGRRKKPHQQM